MRMLRWRPERVYIYLYSVQRVSGWRCHKAVAAERLMSHALPIGLGL